MFKQTTSLALAASLFAVSACDTAATESVELERKDAVTLSDKADKISLELTPVFGDRAQNQEKAGTKIFTSAAQYEEYFGTAAPAEVDFSVEWLAYHAAGMRNTGGYSVSIEAVDFYDNFGGIVVNTKEEQPGDDCIVTMAITSPFAMAKFDIPAGARWYYPVHETNVYSCVSPNAEETAQVLESFGKWLDMKEELGENYTYSRTFSSVFNFFFRTDFVVKNGVVVSRSYFNDGVTHTWTENGKEVGIHPEGHAPALIDDLYAECLDVVLQQDPEDNFINVVIGEDGLLRSCTYFPKACADDCSRGITSLSNIEFLSSAKPVEMIEPGQLMPSDDFFLNEVTVDGDILKVTVGYAGGCQPHEFNLYWNGLVFETFPVQVDLQLTHDANGDNCEAFITETVEFDLSRVTAVSSTPAIVNVDAPGKSLSVQIQQ